MSRFWTSEVTVRFRAAALLGALSSTFSTLASQFAAGRIGRDALVDWLTVAAIPFRDAALSVTPTAPMVLGGILFHQWADFSWALLFFGMLGRWTARLRPATLALLAVPWAATTSALEWLVLVPLAPFSQPIFTLEQPYWIGFFVHLSSALIYPLFPSLRDWMAGSPTNNPVFARCWAAGAVLVVLGLGALDLLGSTGHEIAWMGRDKNEDRAFIRRMSAHHAQGIEIAKLGAAQGLDPHLRALARLIAAEQIGERRIFDRWWRSWFDDPPEGCSGSERAEMPGMLQPDWIERLHAAQGSMFDRLFVSAMTYHHRGAVTMAEDELHSGGDARLRTMAWAIRHGQQGEIEMMRGTTGLDAVKAAIGNMISARLAIGDRRAPQ